MRQEINFLKTEIKEMKEGIAVLKGKAPIENFSETTFAQDILKPNVASQTLQLAKRKPAEVSYIMEQVDALAMDFQKKQKRKEELKHTLDTLFENYYWALSKISVIEGRFQTSEGKWFSEEIVKKSIEMKSLWDIFPEEFEVECRHCGDKVPVSTYLRDDKVSVQCPHCKNNTLLGTSQQGFDWVLFESCSHFQQIPTEDKPKKCCLCGIESEFYHNWWKDVETDMYTDAHNYHSWARTPARYGFP